MRLIAILLCDSDEFRSNFIEIIRNTSYHCNYTYWIDKLNHISTSSIYSKGLKYNFLVSGLLRCTHSQENPSADDVLQQVGNVVGNIPELQNFNTSVMPSVEQARDLFKEKCTKNGGPDAFDNAQKAQTEMTECVRSLVNITELQAEMEKYKPTGDLDIVFKNYCNKRSILRACVHNFTNTVEHCLDEKERENKKIVMNITDSLLEFICFKQGDRIARK